MEGHVVRPTFQDHRMVPFDKTILWSASTDDESEFPLVKNTGIWDQETAIKLRPALSLDHKASISKAETHTKAYRHRQACRQTDTQINWRINGTSIETKQNLKDRETEPERHREASEHATKQMHR